MATKNIESLIKLSCGYLNDIDSLLPGYSEKINALETKKPKSEYSDSDIRDFGIEASNIIANNGLLIETNNENKIDLTGVEAPKNIILYDAQGKHFAYLFIPPSQNKEAYLMDSLPDYSNWKFIGDYSINKIPVPLQKSNECLINTLVNAEYAEQFKEIYLSSHMKNEEIEKLAQITREMMCYKLLKNIIQSSNEDIKQFTKKLNSQENYFLLSNNKIIDFINKNINSNKTLDQKIFFKNLTKKLDKEIFNCKQKIKHIKGKKNSLSKKAQAKRIKQKQLSKQQKAIKNDNLKQEIEEFKEIKRSYLTTISQSKSTRTNIIIDSLSSLMKDINLSLKEIKSLSQDLEKISKKLEQEHDISLANDIIANIKLAKNLEKNSSKKGKTFKSAIKETKIMLGL